MIPYISFPKKDHTFTITNTMISPEFPMTFPLIFYMRPSSPVYAADNLLDSGNFTSNLGGKHVIQEHVSMFIEQWANK